MTTKSNAGQAGTTDTKSTIESTFKDSDYFDNNQFINELNRYLVEIENRKKSIRRRHLIFDLVFSIGMALLIIQLILQW